MQDADRIMKDGCSLTGSDPAPVKVVNVDATGDFLFTCDHACNQMPVKLGNLGMSHEQLQTHIAWDPGALPVASALSSLFQSPLVYGSYSRLVVDLNRPPQSTGSMPLESAGIPIPGNQNLTEAERQSRLHEIFHPYHDTIDQLLSERQRLRLPTNLVAIHSFTPDYPGEVRPWHVGVIYRHDFGLGTAVVQALRDDSELHVGDNLPFQIHDEGDTTIPQHGERRHLPNVLIEIRQDLLKTTRDRDQWIIRLHKALQRAAQMTSPRDGHAQ